MKRSWLLVLAPPRCCSWVFEQARSWMKLQSLALFCYDRWHLLNPVCSWTFPQSCIKISMQQSVTNFFIRSTYNQKAVWGSVGKTKAWQETSSMWRLVVLRIGEHQAPGIDWFPTTFLYGCLVSVRAGLAWCALGFPQVLCCWVVKELSWTCY